MQVYVNFNAIESMFPKNTHEPARKASFAMFPDNNSSIDAQARAPISTPKGGEEKKMPRVAPSVSNFEAPYFFAYTAGKIYRIRTFFVIEYG